MWIWDGCWERSDKNSKDTGVISTSNRVRDGRVVIRRVGVESNLSVFISSNGVYICAKKSSSRTVLPYFANVEFQHTHTRREEDRCPKGRPTVRNSKWTRRLSTLGESSSNRLPWSQGAVMMATWFLKPVAPSFPRNLSQRVLTDGRVKCFVYWR